MNYRFDVDKWLLQQLPIVLRRPKLYSLIRCISTAINAVYMAFSRYSKDVLRRLDHTSQVISLERWLNSFFHLDGDIVIRDYTSGNIYLHFQGEMPNDIYVGFIDESTEIYLPKYDPSALRGGFVVYVPSDLATEENLKTIQKWVEYYKMAGTEYKIEAYE